MASLRELSAELQELYYMASELPTEEQDVFKDTLEAVSGELGCKLDGYMSVIASLQADCEMIKKEEKRLSDKRTVIENNIARMKESIKFFVANQPERKFATDFYKFSIRKNAPALKYDDKTADIPIQFLVPQDPKFDKEAMKKAIKNGETFEGFELVSSESLLIK